MNNDEILGIDWTKAKEKQEITVSVFPSPPTVQSGSGADVVYIMSQMGDSIQFIPDYAIIRYVTLCQTNVANGSGQAQLPRYLWCSLINNIVAPIFQSNAHWGTVGNVVRTDTFHKLTYGKLDRIIKIDKPIDTITFRMISQNANLDLNSFTTSLPYHNLEIAMDFYKF